MYAEAEKTLRYSYAVNPNTDAIITIDALLCVTLPFA
jgi:hypothetical protein